MLLFVLVSAVDFEMFISTCVHSSLERRRQRPKAKQTISETLYTEVPKTLHVFHTLLFFLQAFAERLVHRKIPQHVFPLSHVHQKKSVLVGSKYFFVALWPVLSLQIN